MRDRNSEAEKKTEPRIVKLDVITGNKMLLKTSHGILQFLSFDWFTYIPFTKNQW